MAKPIKLTEENINSAIEEFRDKITKFRMVDGSINYKHNFKFQGNISANLMFTHTAYIKINALVREFSSEVAWYGVGERVDDNSYLITDILVYPQKVTGATVDLNEGEYAKWRYENLEDERFSHIVLQGHSHVNFKASPSGTDDEHMQQILDQLDDEQFYIFIIVNKSGDIYTKIYDFANNVMYEDADVDCKLIADFDLTEFITDAKSRVENKVIAPKYNSPYNGSKTVTGASAPKNDVKGYTSKTMPPIPRYESRGVFDDYEYSAPPFYD